MGTLPRTRGGVSEIEVEDPVDQPSSPHPRGCFLEMKGEVVAKCLFPAPAGVFLPTEMSPTGNSALPRTRGGVSVAAVHASRLQLSSPHPRGCFFASKAEFPAGELFPAPAGVFP